MTHEQVIAIARGIALEEGWLWLEPVRAIRFRQWLIGPARWEVRSNAGHRGCSVKVVVDDTTGTVRKKGFLPR